MLKHTSVTIMYWSWTFAGTSFKFRRVNTYFAFKYQISNFLYFSSYCIELMSLTTHVLCLLHVCLCRVCFRWGWLGFNCGSTFGISGVKWKLAAR